jgi:hypothetical protein
VIYEIVANCESVRTKKNERLKGNKSGLYMYYEQHREGVLRNTANLAILILEGAKQQKARRTRMQLLPLLDNPIILKTKACGSGLPFCPSIFLLPFVIPFYLLISVSFDFFPLLDCLCLAENCSVQSRHCSCKRDDLK